MQLAEIVLAIFGFGGAVHGWIAARRIRETDPAAPEEVAQLQEELWRTARVSALMELFIGFGLLAVVGADVLGGTTMSVRFWPWIAGGVLAGFGAIITAQVVRVGRIKKILQQSEGRRFVERLKGDADATRELAKSD